MQLSFGILISLAIALFAAAQDPVPIVFKITQILDEIAPAECKGANFASCSGSIIDTVSSILSLDPSTVGSVAFGKVSYFRWRFDGNEDRTMLSYLVTTESTNTESYATLTNALIAAIGDGSFTTTMQTFGTSDSNALATATAPSQADGGHLSVDNQLDDGSSSKLGGGAIAGIVIGGVVFLALVGILFVYLLRREKSQAEYTAAKTKPAEPVSTVNTV